MAVATPSGAPRRPMVSGARWSGADCWPASMCRQSAPAGRWL